MRLAHQPQLEINTPGHSHYLLTQKQIGIQENSVHSLDQGDGEWVQPKPNLVCVQQLPRTKLDLANSSSILLGFSFNLFALIHSITSSRHQFKSSFYCPLGIRQEPTLGLLSCRCWPSWKTAQTLDIPQRPRGRGAISQHHLLGLVREEGV